MFKHILKESVISKKKLSKITEYITAISNDFKEGSLKYVKSSRNFPIQPLNLEALSDDSTDDKDRGFDKEMSEISFSVGSKADDLLSSHLKKRKSTKMHSTSDI